MSRFEITIVQDGISRDRLSELAADGFGDMVKAVVDVVRRRMAIGGELHSDEESALLDDGSRQSDLWGINIYPAENASQWIEFDSMINVRPAHGNRSRYVEDDTLQKSIVDIVNALVTDE